MIVVDTTVWADWFNGTQTPEVDRLDRALTAQDAGLTPLILTEVLQGFRADADFERARALLARLPVLELDVDGHVAAAALFRRLRRRGITVRGAVDCIVAQTCIAANAALLTGDRDFTAIARHAPLRLCAVKRESTASTTPIARWPIPSAGRGARESRRRGKAGRSPRGCR